MQDGRNKHWRRTRFERQRNAALEQERAIKRQKAQERAEFKEARAAAIAQEQIERCYKQHVPTQIRHCAEVLS